MKNTYTRGAVHEVKEVMEVFAQEKDTHVFAGENVIDMKSKRYKIFNEHGANCMRCGLEGKYFAEEFTESHFLNTKSKKRKFHLNLYAEDKTTMIHTFMLTSFKDGGRKEDVDNNVVLCADCLLHAQKLRNNEGLKFVKVPLTHVIEVHKDDDYLSNLFSIEDEIYSTYEKFKELNLATNQKDKLIYKTHESVREYLSNYFDDVSDKALLMLKATSGETNLKCKLVLFLDLKAEENVAHYQLLTSVNGGDGNYCVLAKKVD